jgi:GMP synthase (glutamine-hydrolysing)
MTDPRFLLLQARLSDDVMAAHEHRCFAETLGVPLERVRCHDLLRGPPSDADLAACDLLLVGGSGSFSVLDDHRWLKDFYGFLEHVAIPRALPVFASCFGFQALVVAGGGEVIHDVEHAEVGTFEVTLTEAGLRDPLLAGCAPSFVAQFGHKDRAARLPSGVVSLAGSERAPYQAFRIPGTPIVATQFHPELDVEGNLHRYRAYLAIYVSNPETCQDDVTARSRPSPEASALLPGWVREVLRG